MKIVALPAFAWGARKRKRTRPTRVVIQAGKRGWEGIFFQEAHKSLQEFVGNNQVLANVVDRERPFVPQLRAALSGGSATHLLFDPRTTSDQTSRALFQAFYASLCLLARGVTPIVFLTDASCRSWRMQSAIVTSWSGLVVTCISSKELSSLFPHPRLIGPVLMPLSNQTLGELKRPNSSIDSRTSPVVRFVGLAYSPRIEWLTKLQETLLGRGITLQLHTSKAATSNDAYWELLLGTDILVTTTMQITNPHYDWTWKPQVLFRFTEALAAGTTLVATDVPGLARFLRPGCHYAAYASLDECAETVERLVRDWDWRERLARDGNDRIKALVESNTFWSQVDASLGRHSLL